MVGINGCSRGLDCDHCRCRWRQLQEGNIQYRCYFTTNTCRTGDLSDTHLSGPFNYICASSHYDRTTSPDYDRTTSPDYDRTAYDRTDRHPSGVQLYGNRT
jgi:hypothetical protein